MWSHLQLLQRDYIRSDDLIPISTTSHSFISNDMEIGAPINGDASIDHHAITNKSGLSCANAGLFRVPRSLQIKIRLLSGWREKTHSLEKRILRHSFLLQYTCSVAHSMRARRWLPVRLTNTIGLRAHRPTAWRWFRTIYVEILVPVADWRCCRRR